MKHLIAASIALTLLGSTAAMAQRDSRDYQGQNYQGQNDRGQNFDRRQNNDGRFDSQGYNDRNNDRPHWSRGDRLPEQYRQNQYVVSDWRTRGLRQPPRGHSWVRNDNNQYVLAAIRSGIIAEIVSQNMYRDDYRWSRGERLNNRYRGNRYVVSDWRGNNLRRPPRGQHWVHVNDQYMLTMIASGVIAEVLLNNGR